MKRPFNSPALSLVTLLGTGLVGAACGNGSLVTATPDGGHSAEPPVEAGPVTLPPPVVSVDAGGPPFTVLTPTKPMSGKVDLLFDIDSSASMGDKQDLLAQAIPDFVGRLVKPNCVPGNGGAPYPSTATATEAPTCRPGDSLEFAPVHDLHLAIVSSSLGPRGGDVCTPGTGGYSLRADDQAHLLGTGTPAWPAAIAADETSSNFLAWFPSWSSNPGPSPDTPLVTDPSILLNDFTDVIGAVGVNGCGIESQLESWYRFLIQPDPYLSIDVADGAASWSDAIDPTILAQRAAFLRPDSIVGIIVLTDENDSEIDVRSYGGTAFNFMLADFLGDCSSSDFCPTQAPPICATDPTSPNCTYDPNEPPYKAVNGWGYDINLRHVHMWQKYALDPQYPIARYVTGLSSALVPDRSQEYPVNAAGQVSPNYVGTTLNCRNPLFAGSLISPPPGAVTTWSADHDALCNQPAGTRTPDMVFYEIIGGVPFQDLHYPAAASNGTVDWMGYALSNEDWQWIVGRDPERYDYTGIDPHMIEDFQDRHHPTFPATIGTPPAADVGASAALGPLTASEGNAATGWDPISGREWSTNDMGADGLPVHAKNGLTVDREYACIFKLQTPHDCTQQSEASRGCDCQVAPGALTHAQLPPLCNEANPNQQDYAKAYPTTRELLVARNLAAVPGANPGLVSSICPQDVVDNADGNDPFYGYRPAMDALVARMEERLTTTCIPPLPVSTNGDVACAALAVFSSGATPATCTNTPGLTAPDPTALAELKSSIALPSTSIVCGVTQTPVPPGSTCADNTQHPGFCYVTGAVAAPCTAELTFATSLEDGPLAKATVNYVCSR